KDFPENEQLKSARDGAPPPVVEGPKTPWNGQVGAGELEKIIGAASTLVSVNYLDIGLKRSRAVVRLVFPDSSSGTGFLIEGNTIVTNHHVLQDAETARASRAQFNYQLTAERRNAPVDEFHLAPDAFFRTSEADDWSAVRVEGNPTEKWGALPLVKSTVKVG